MNSTARVDEKVHGKVMEVDLPGKLDREDNCRFVQEIEKMIREQGKTRILVTMHGFRGWKADALREDIQWDTQHFRHIDRMAIVGEKTWHKWMTGFYKPFTAAVVRYFTPDQIDAARAWLLEEKPYLDMSMGELLAEQRKVVSELQRTDQEPRFQANKGQPREIWDGSEAGGKKQP